MSLEDLDPNRVLDTDTELNRLVQRIGCPDLLALDTEFHSERRYTPELMLVQLAVRDGPVWTIDPRKVDLALLKPILSDTAWLVHGASWDIRLVAAATGARPARLLDTQLLGAFAGLHYPARLSSLAQQALGQTVDKGATMSDWSQRPLSPEQLDYARGDVAVLFPLFDALSAQITLTDARCPERRGAGLAWAEAAGKELVDQALRPSDPDQRWRELDIAPDFDAPTRQALHLLYMWRESEARRRHSPPHFVLSPSIALDLARRRPRDIPGLRANRRMPQGLVKRHGAALLRILDDAQDATTPPPPVPRPAQGVVALLQALRSVMSLRLGIAPRVLLPRQTIHDLAAGARDQISGWRETAIAKEIHDLLSGRSALRLHQDRVVMEHVRQIGHLSPT